MGRYIFLNVRQHKNFLKFERFVIFGKDDTILTLEDEMLKEGEVIGAEVSFDMMEQKAELKSGWLFVKVFIEKVELYM